MRLVTVGGIDPQQVASVVGAATFVKAVAAAQQGDVQHMDWDGAAHVLYALVRGGARRYEPAVYFRAAGGRLTYAMSRCACRATVHCVHAVAAVLAATQAAEPDAARWERSLDALVSPAAPAPDAAVVPLGVELSLTMPSRAPGRYGATEAQPRLLARVVRPGRSGWVSGNLSWGRLPALHGFGEYEPDHIQLLCEWHALHRTRTYTSGYWATGDDRTIDLSHSGERLWSLLDDAARLGVQVVYARKLGSLPPYTAAQLLLDVTGEGTGLAVTPVLRVEGMAEPQRPVLFLGAEGHGVVHVGGVPAGEPALWPIRLARLDPPATPALQEMVLTGQRISVPAGSHARFARAFYPRLRRLAPVTSSDGAFGPPAISEPSLVLHAEWGDAHDLDLRWEWSYTVGEQTLRAPVGGGEGDFRDPNAERALLDELDLPLREFGLRGDGPELHRHTRLQGLSTMRFSTELLPLLHDAPGVVVEQAGAPAVYREAGDSLRIGVSTGAVEGDTDWFDLGVTLTVEGREVPFSAAFTALAAGETHLLLPDGAYFSLQKPELQSLRTLIEEARALQDTPSGPLRISRFQVGLWEELAALGVVDRQAEAWQQQVSGLLSAGDLGEPELPVGLRATLRPYQRDGFAWLCFLHRHGLGGILADDMGLGKTLQTLALIRHVHESRSDAPPFLIVAPTSVVANWAAEAARFTPDLHVVAINDTLRRRGSVLAEVTAGAHVVVTSYTLFRLDEDAYAAAEWSGLVLDEAQFVKNHQSKIHQCARKLPAPFKLAISGTPMENNVTELWSLLSITAPGLFPSPTRFQEHYARPIERKGDTEQLARLRRRIRPLVKRRTKEQVAADLPPKQEQVLEIELEPRHRRVYERHLQRERQKVLGLLDDVERNRFTILRSITLLRQLSLHPALVDPEQLRLGSSKIDALLDQLDDVIGGGHRALVFSQFTGFLGKVRERLDAEGVGYAYLDGHTRNRAKVVEGFRSGSAPVFLISLKAGGFGLNLTEADYCFLLDPWWNPATEAQAIDRTHRIGQTRNVMVYRLIAKDTIEEKVLALARRKAELFTGVMDEGDAFGTALTAEDLRELLD
ncbi:MAG TPA: DEAD/DEAH box helicase [Pseudonocardia sp.]